jgi:glycosyltransferase involved in cell wall biosynthesis
VAGIRAGFSVGWPKLTDPDAELVALESSEHYVARARFSRFGSPDDEQAPRLTPDTVRLLADEQHRKQAATPAKTVSTPTQEPHLRSAGPTGERPRVLMLGMGWFPASLGGLNRYYRSLFEQLPEARGVVVGPSEDAPSSINVVGPAQLPLRLLGFWRSARRAAVGTDVVDAHFALYAFAPLLTGALGGRPLVFHFHGPWAEENVSAGDSSRVRFVLRAALERRVLRGADAHIVLSSAFRRVLLERYRVRPWDVHVWDPGVALDVFTPGDRRLARERLELDPSAFVAICVRRLVPRMGIDGLLDAWAEIADALPERSELLLVGDGALRESLAERAERAPLAGRVRVLGRLTDEQLIEAYRAADVAVVPSVALEGFGLIVPEAAACGTPSIVTDAGGLPEAAITLDPSLVVPAGEVKALGERIEAAAQGSLPTRADTRSFAEGYSWARLAERHRSLYGRLLRGERDERLRVVFLDHVARLSGGEIALMRLLTHFQRIDPHVILGEDGPLADRLSQARVSVEVLPVAPSARDARRDTVTFGATSPAAALHTLAYIARLTRRLRVLAPDVVHTNSLKAGVYGSIAAKAAGIPLVWHVRDRIADDYIPRAAVHLVRALIRNLADGVVANSTATLETLPPATRGPLSWVIPGSVELSPYPAPTPSGPATFGMLGRIAPWKGQDLFLRAFAAAFPDGRQRAVLVGSAMFGEEGYEHELHALASSLGIAERVEFRGFREDVWAELASLDVLVHASVIPEPFGTVVLEGMAAGLAVIAADEGGPASVIADGRTGCLFRSREVGSLCAAMRALSEDPRKRERLGSTAREALADYHPAAVAARLEQVYVAVLDARAGRN